jgi:hypothetical protein
MKLRQQRGLVILRCRSYFISWLTSPCYSFIVLQEGRAPPSLREARRVFFASISCCGSCETLKTLLFIVCLQAVRVFSLAPGLVTGICAFLCGRTIDNSTTDLRASVIPNRAQRLKQSTQPILVSALTGICICKRNKEYYFQNWHTTLHARIVCCNERASICARLY